jgi:hypothetical protein
MLQVPIETAPSSSKILQIPPNCCKDSQNGSFQLQNAANSKENGQKNRSKKKSRNGENIIPKTILDPLLIS